MRRSERVPSRLQPDLTLTRRKVQVLAAVARGLHVKEIATTLGLGIPTVEEHIEQLRRVFHAKSNAQLVIFGIQHGFIRPTEDAEDGVHGGDSA